MPFSCWINTVTLRERLHKTMGIPWDMKCKHECKQSYCVLSVQKDKISKNVEVKKKKKMCDIPTTLVLTLKHKCLNPKVCVSKLLSGFILELKFIISSKMYYSCTSISFSWWIACKINTVSCSRMYFFVFIGSNFSRRRYRAQKFRRSTARARNSLPVVLSLRLPMTVKITI